MASQRFAVVDKDSCVSCGACENICPIGAIEVYRGSYAKVDNEHCIGCGKCADICPAYCIELNERPKNEGS